MRTLIQRTGGRGKWVVWGVSDPRQGHWIRTVRPCHFSKYWQDGKVSSEGRLDETVEVWRLRTRIQIPQHCFNPLLIYRELCSPLLLLIHPLSIPPLRTWFRGQNSWRVGLRGPLDRSIRSITHFKCSQSTPTLQWKSESEWNWLLHYCYSEQSRC